MEPTDQILIVDDDPDLRQLLSDYLSRNGYATSAVADGEAMWRALLERQPDLIVLDLMLPGEDGLSLCRRLRVQSDIPIVMLTARGDDTDRIVGLEMGADDYLPKPFNPRELLARIKVVLRRTRALPRNLRPEPGRYLAFASWKLDTAGRQLLNADGVLHALSGAEYSLLHVLLTHPNRVLSRDQLLDLTSGREAGPYDRSIDVLISRLRQRVGDDAREPALIKTVRNGGYVLAASVQRVDQ